MLDYQKEIESLLSLPPYQLDNAEKQSHLLRIFTYLHVWHSAHCQSYAHLTGVNSVENVSLLSELPYVAVRLFKLFELSSIAKKDIFKIVYSSGTTGQTPSKVFLDRETSALQSKTLVKILQSFLGKQRLPMLVIDTPSVLKKDGSYSARAAGIQGLSMFSREQCFILNDDMSLNKEALLDFVSRHQDKPVLAFGFTFMVWQHLLQELKRLKLKVALPQGILLHSGGWKKLEAEKVSNADFKKTVEQTLGIHNVHNFYGMAEQTGTIFVECEHGFLHTPNMAEVLIRDPQTLEMVDKGKIGLIQVLSVLPKSYPGYSILTEDMGQIVGEDDCKCGRNGKYFNVMGRLPKTEVRGCSDTHLA